MIYSKIGGRAYGGDLQHPLPLPKKIPQLLASQGDSHVRTGTQIKFLYDPLHYKFIEEQQKVIANMQEKIHALEAKVYELVEQRNVMQTLKSSTKDG